jgi:tRNA G18 (ribose-2'-O)-methylase SpoU
MKNTNTQLSSAYLKPFGEMTDGELTDPKQLVGLARAIDPEGSPERLRTGLFIAESINVIDRALSAGYVPFAVLTDERWLYASKDLLSRIEAAFPGTPVVVASTQEITDITGYATTRGPLAAFYRNPPQSVTDLLQAARRVAILEDITNYTNMGAIFRSAAALGIDAVLLTPSCHDPLFRRASRVSMGTVFQVPWARFETGRDWAEEGMPLLKQAGFTTCALALSDDSISLADPQLKTHAKLALILGTEGEGLRASTIEASDYAVRIPMHHAVDSLNVAAASAVAFWELRAREEESD